MKPALERFLDYINSEIREQEEKAIRVAEKGDVLVNIQTVLKGFIEQERKAGRQEVSL